MTLPSLVLPGKAALLLPSCTVEVCAVNVGMFISRIMKSILFLCASASYVFNGILYVKCYPVYSILWSFHLRYLHFFLFQSFRPFTHTLFHAHFISNRLKTFSHTSASLLCFDVCWFFLRSHFLIVAYGCCIYHCHNQSYDLARCADRVFGQGQERNGMSF